MSALLTHSLSSLASLGFSSHFTTTAAPSLFAAPRPAPPLQSSFFSLHESRPNREKRVKMGLSAKKSRKRGKRDSDSDEYDNMEYEEVEDDYDDDGEEEDEEEEHGEEVTDDEDGTGEHGEWKNDEMEQLEKEYRDLHHQELDTLKNLKHHKDEDLLKGQAVKSQKALWYKILELRFLLQKPFSSSNRLPQVSIKSLFCETDETVRVAYSDLMTSSKETLDSILELQEALFAKNPSITQAIVGSEGSSKDLEVYKHLDGNLDQEWSQISQMHKSITSFRDKSINKWQRVTQVTTGAAAIKGKLHAFNQDISNQVAAYMRDPSRLIKQMRVPEVVGEPKEAETCTDGDPELLDDSEFYQQLLKEFFETVDPSSSEKAFYALKRMQPKKRKIVDRRASKSRKIRYNVHEKIVNFMAPLPANVPPMAPKLFENLFGLKTQRSSAAAS
ncbi:Protein AATF [Glycine soja]